MPIPRGASWASTEAGASPLTTPGGVATTGSAILGCLVGPPFQGDIDMDVEVDVDIDWYFGSLKGGSKSVQVLFNGIEAVVVLTLISQEWGALSDCLAVL